MHAVLLVHFLILNFLKYAFNHHGSGKVSWAKLVEPAINLAERMEIDDYLAGVLEVCKSTVTCVVACASLFVCYDF